MDIVINNEKLDFEITGDENNCETIIEDLKKEMFDKQHVILETLVNNEKYHKDKHNNLNISDIKKIEIKSEHIEVLAVNSLNELKKYTERVNHYVSEIKNNSEKFSEDKLNELLLQVKDGFTWCHKAIVNVAKIIGFPESETFDKLCQEIMNKVNAMEAVFDVQEIKQYFIQGNIENINKIIEQIIVMLYNDFKTKKTLLSFKEIHDKTLDFQKQLNDFNEKLVNISEKLQVGESVEAMNLLKKELGFLEDIIKFYNQIQTSVSIDFNELIINEKSLKNCLDDFLELNKELLECFETQDYIMLSDLIEYELSEYIDIFVQSFEKIDEIVKNLEKAEGIAEGEK